MVYKMDQFEDYVLSVSWEIGMFHCALSLSPSTLCLLLMLHWAHSNIPVGFRGFKQTSTKQTNKKKHRSIKKTQEMLNECGRGSLN